MYKVNLLGLFNVCDGLGEVSLLFIKQTQLIESEGNQVVIISDMILSESTHKHTDGRIYRISLTLSKDAQTAWTWLSVGVLPGQDLREAELRLQ